MYKELPIFVKTTLPYGKGYFKYFKILFIAFFSQLFPFLHEFCCLRKVLCVPFKSSWWDTIWLFSLRNNLLLYNHLSNKKHFPCLHIAWYKLNTIRIGRIRDSYANSTKSAPLSWLQNSVYIFKWEHASRPIRERVLSQLFHKGYTLIASLW